jgi:hypothetical protein
MAAMRPARLLTIPAAALLLAACTPPDPNKEVALSGFEGYWVVDRPLGGQTRIAPAVRFTLANHGAGRSVQATATFRRKGEEQLEWGSAWVQVSPAGTPIPRGESKVVVMISDAHYTSPGEPEAMFGHEQFKDARAEVFIRVGSSQWVKMGTVDIERRLGTKELEPAR